MKTSAKKLLPILLILFVQLVFAQGEQGPTPNDKNADFFDVSSLYALSSAMFIVLVVTNVSKMLKVWKPMYIALILSFLISFIGTYHQISLDDERDSMKLMDFFLILINGCLLFTNSLGLNEGGNAINGGGGAAVEAKEEGKRAGFFASWIR